MQPGSAAGTLDAQHPPDLDNGRSGEQQAGSLPWRAAPIPSGTGWGVSSFLKCLRTSLCPSGEWEKALVPLPVLRDLGRRRRTASHTPPHDADDPSPLRMVSHDLFLGAYVISEANLGSTGSTTIRAAFPHVQTGMTLT